MRARDSWVDLDEARRRLDYDPSTGLFVWRYQAPRKSFQRCLIGTVAGRVGKLGYRDIRLNNRFVKAHRLAWGFMTGAMPDSEIDHINRIRDDNRWSNLRLATPAQNNWNVGVRAGNKWGLKGVSFWAKNGKYKAQIAVHGVKHFLGYHSTPEEAHAAYVAAAIRLHGEFASTA
jgi:hypothetical protein